MTIKRPIVFIGLLSLIMIPSNQSFAQDTMGQIISRDQQRERQETLRDRITTPRPDSPEEEAKKQIEQEQGPKVLVTNITVEGVSIINRARLEDIVSEYEGRELTFNQMQQCADDITAEYRKSGFVTSRAYIPPQSVKTGKLIIRVVEGKLGSLEIKGNEHFKTDFIRQKIDLKDDGYFDYSALQKSLVYINEHPDRTAKVVLVPGRLPGTTDVVVNVKDELPIHAGFIYDNYASRFLEKDRYAIFLEHNNVLGQDDKLYVKGLTTENDRLKMIQGRYSHPFSQSLEGGFHFLFSDSENGRDFVGLESTGKAEIFGVYVSKELFNEENLEVRFNTAFDIKEIKNSFSGTQTSRDELRVLTTGMDFDYTDRWGRTIVTTEAHVGFEDTLGGMARKDPEASRTGAGGRFQKGVFYIFRLQPLFNESALLLKNTAQYTNHNLVASEQFQIGGPHSVRGYAPAEQFGDRGYYSAVEYSFPFWGLSKEWKIPYKKRDVRFYDALRGVVFYDIATVWKRRPAAGEEHRETLKGWGYGVRLNVEDDLQVRFEVGYPLDGRSADGKWAHPWAEVRLKF